MTTNWKYRYCHLKVFFHTNKFTLHYQAELSWLVKFSFKTLWPLFMDGIQLLQGYRATTRRQLNFYHYAPRNSRYSFVWPWKDERLSRPWSHPVALNTGPLDWESSTLNTRPLLINYFFIWRKNDTLFSRYFNFFWWFHKLQNLRYNHWHSGHDEDC